MTLHFACAAEKRKMKSSEMQGAVMPGWIHSWDTYLRAFLAAALLISTGCNEEHQIRGLPPREKAELEKLFAEARQLDDAGRYHEALVRYETILVLHPEFVSTRLNAAMAAYDSGQYQKSADH